MNQTQTKSLRLRLKTLLPYLTIPLILLVCYVLWVNLHEEQFASVYSNNATWDLRDMDFENATASLRGRVEYIPVPFLTPEEFAGRIAQIFYSCGNNRIFVLVGIFYVCGYWFYIKPRSLDLLGYGGGKFFVAAVFICEKFKETKHIPVYLCFGDCVFVVCGT